MQRARAPQLHGFRQSPFMQAKCGGHSSWERHPAGGRSGSMLQHISVQSITIRTSIKDMSRSMDQFPTIGSLKLKIRNEFIESVTNCESVKREKNFVQEKMDEREERSRSPPRSSEFGRGRQNSDVHDRQRTDTEPDRHALPGRQAVVGFPTVPGGQRHSALCLRT